MQPATCAKGVLVLVQELGAAVSDRPSIVLHNEVICGLLRVILEPPIAVQVLLQLGTECAVCCLSTVCSHQSVARTDPCWKHARSTSTGSLVAITSLR